MKHTILVLAVLCSFLSCSLAQKEEKASFSQEQIMSFYEKMIEQIDAIDAEAIAVRNSNKQVSWEQYKNYHKDQFEKVKTDQEFRTKFGDFAHGFSNGHSYFQFHFPVELPPEKHQESNVKIGYTFPKVSFFDLTSKKTITHINDKPIEQIFEHFDNYETSALTTIRSQRSFKRRFEASRLLIDGQLPKTLTLEDGKKLEITYKPKPARKKSLTTYYTGIELEEDKDWKQIAVGYKAALLQKEKVAMIKIKNFIYPNHSNEGLRCEGDSAPDSTQCADIQLLRKALTAIDKEVDYLIFDLQNNPGGNENSVFLAEFCPKSFEDLAVEYRKTSFLENDYLRAYLFYGSKRAEEWFRELKSSGVYNKIKEGDFLPARADFCQGAKNCALVPIAPNNKDAYHFKKYYVLVNEGTASSGDDFTYRMKRFGNAIIAGQPQASDLTYATVSIIFYQDEEGKIQHLYGDGEVKGTKIAEITIPLSRSIDENGELLQGNPLELDIPVKLTKANFEKREESVLETVLKDIEQNMER